MIPPLLQSQIELTKQHDTHNIYVNLSHEATVANKLHYTTLYLRVH